MDGLADLGSALLEMGGAGLNTASDLPPSKASCGCVGASFTMIIAGLSMLAYSSCHPAPKPYEKKPEQVYTQPQPAEQPETYKGKESK